MSTLDDIFNEEDLKLFLNQCYGLTEEQYTSRFSKSIESEKTSKTATRKLLGGGLTGVLLDAYTTYLNHLEVQTLISKDVAAQILSQNLPQIFEQGINTTISLYRTSQEAKVALKQVELVQSQKDKIDEDLSLVTQQILTEEKTTALVDNQATKVSKDSLLTDQQILSETSNTTLVTNQASNIAQNTLLLTAQTTKVGKDGLLVDKQVLTEEQNKSVLENQASKIVKDGLLVDQQTASFRQDTIHEYLKLYSSVYVTNSRTYADVDTLPDDIFKPTVTDGVNGPSLYSKLLQQAQPTGIVGTIQIQPTPADTPDDTTA